MRELAVVLMLPPPGDAPSERWVADGRLAAALDLMERLQRAFPRAPRYALVPGARQAQALAARGARVIPSDVEGFHFGQALADMAAQAKAEALAYFGGASAPLLGAGALRQMAAQLQGSSAPALVTNNLHSSDWALLKPAAALGHFVHRLPNDNALAWVLREEGGFTVHVAARNAATSVDVDTPADLLMLQGHPGLGAHLGAFLERAPAELRRRVDAIRQLLRAEGRCLAIIGRSSATIWRTLERATRLWVRMFAEERGMVASGRLQAGEVRSLLAEATESWGAEAFIRRLEQMADGVLWDTRVWMAHRGGWPSAADRFAADLGWTDQVADPALRALTAAINRARIPILTGGHGLVSGDVLALLETEFGPQITSPG